MRSPHRRQMPLTVRRSAHARAKELAETDRLLEDNPSLAAMVARDLPHTKGASADNGRPGLTGDQVLRAAIVRVPEACSYDELAFYLSDSQSYRWFCRIGWGEGSPSDSTLQENIRRVTPATWEAVNAALVKQAVALGVETGGKTRIDCTEGWPIQPPS